MVLVVKDPPANPGDLRELGLSPGSGRSLEVEVATHSRIVTWRTPWAEEPGRLQPKGPQRAGQD